MNKWTEINFLASCTLIWEGLRVLERKEGTFFAIWRRRKKCRENHRRVSSFSFSVVAIFEWILHSIRGYLRSMYNRWSWSLFSLLSLCRHHSGWPEQSFPDVRRRLRCQQPCPKLRCLRQCDRKSPWIGCSCWPK